MILYVLYTGGIAGLMCFIIWTKEIAFKRKTSYYIITLLVELIINVLNMYFTVAGNFFALSMLNVIYTFWVFMCARLFTEGAIYFNIVLWMALCKISTVAGYVVLRPFPGLFRAVSEVSVERFLADPSDCIIGFLVELLCGWFVSMVYRKIFPREYTGSDRPFKIIAIILYSAVLVSHNIRMVEQKRGNYEDMLIVIMQMFISVGVFVLVYNVGTRIYVKHEQEERRRTLELLDRNYREAVEKNRELKKIKHDLNKELQVIRALADSGQYTEARNGMLDIIEKHSEYAELSFSGDARFDMFVSMVYREAKDKNVILENIIEQSKENIEVLGRYIPVLSKVIDEVMGRSIKSGRSEKDDRPWLRLSCRKVGRQLLFNVEYSISQTDINRRRFISLITITRAASLKSEQLMKSSIVADGGNYCIEEAMEEEFLALCLTAVERKHRYEQQIF